MIASIEEPELIERILAHRRHRGEDALPAASLGARAPQASLLAIEIRSALLLAAFGLLAGAPRAWI